MTLSFAEYVVMRWDDQRFWASPPAPELWYEAMAFLLAERAPA